MNLLERGRDILSIELESLKAIRDGLGPEFEAACLRLKTCVEDRGKILVSGIGKNLHIAEKISATFSSTGSTSVVLNPAQAMHGDLGIVQQGDILLALSYSGESEELLALLPIMHRLGIPVLAMTGCPSSSLAANADLVLPVPVQREACPFNMAPTSSTTVTLAMGDALAMVLLEARGFQREDYAKLHPGGAIGRALLLRVHDIMRSSERLARVQAETPVRDVLIAMTQARTGLAGVVDDTGQLLGIFTDGDLRRGLTETPDLLNSAVHRFMTANPVTVYHDQLAVDVLKIFEEHNIDDLPVVDRNQRWIGQVDIQDLPKVKIL